MSSFRLNFCLSALLLIGALLLPSHIAAQRTVPLRHPIDVLARQVGDWRSRDRALGDRVRAVLGTDQVLLRQYDNPVGGSVELYVSYYARQRQGETSHSPRHCLPGAGWIPVQHRLIPLPLVPRDAARINEILYEKDGARQLVYYWYRERERVIASEYLVKWYLILDAITRQRTDGALLRISTPVHQGEAKARARALAFMRLIVPLVNEILPS